MESHRSQGAPSGSQRPSLRGPTKRPVEAARPECYPSRHSGGIVESVPMSGNGADTPEQVVKLEPKARPHTYDTPVEEVGQTIVAKIQRAAELANENCDRAMKLAHKLSMELGAAEDRINKLESVRAIESRCTASRGISRLRDNSLRTIGHSKACPRKTSIAVNNRSPTLPSVKSGAWASRAMRMKLRSERPKCARSRPYRRVAAITASHFAVALFGLQFSNSF